MEIGDVLEYRDNDENEWTRKRMQKPVTVNRVASNGGGNLERSCCGRGMTRDAFSGCAIASFVSPEYCSLVGGGLEQHTAM